MAGDDNQNKTKDGEGSSGGITYDSPYYLHPSDYPKQLHVNEILNDNNFADWSQEMTNFLFAKNKIEFVDGTIKKPEKASKDYMPWMRVDAMIKGWLTTAMEKNIRNSVKYAGTALEIWSDLSERFGKESAPRAYELKQKTASTRQGNASVSTYFTQLRSIWDEAQSIYPFPRCSCNKCECDIGRRLNEHQEKERLYEFLMGLNSEFTVIRTQILATKPIPSLGTAYHMVAEDERQRAVSNDKPLETAAFKAFQRRNISAGSNKEKNATKTIEHCTECNRDGHKREGCFKLIGYPEWWPGKKGEKAKGKAACVETETSPIPGLTNENYQLFLKHFSGAGNNDGTKPVANMAYKENEEGEWILDSGCTEYITHLSDILVNKKAAHFEPPVLIPNGDSIPVKGKGDYVLPGGAKGLLKRNLIGTGRCQGGLYRMTMIQGRKAMGTTIETWHKRLGHASKGKLARVQFEKEIKRIRCDNGGEFTSTNMIEFYNKKGILLETTCPHTPQQNGVVERKHRHLLETARALRIGANLPKRFWGECILTAAFVINRLPSKVIKNKTPFELIWNREPDYDLLKVFGCLVYFKNTNTKGDKFEEKGKPGVFLGYPPGTKGYKIFDLETRKLIVSRDVNFHEENFPFKHVQEGHEKDTVEPMICHDCHCHDEPILTQSEVQHPMEQDFQMHHDPVSEQNNSHEVPDEHEVDQENNEGELNSDDLETNEPNEEAHSETRPTRTRTQPSRFKDFVVQVPPSVNHPASTSNQVTSTVCHPISNFVSYDNFSANHKAFLTAINNNDEPKHFKQAAKDARWREAMQTEIKALEKNGTWTLEYLPKGKRAIDSKWVYKIKFKPNGEVERYKARLVAKGFTQMEGVDYHDTFAPVAKLVTVYMKIPQGFSKDGETRVCRLRKSLYGLKQASRNWYHKFTTFLLSLGFKQSKADHSLFIYETKSITMATLIYVDDVIITGNCLDKIQEIKKQLDKEFSVKDLGPLKYFLGIEAAKTSDGLVLSQRKYTLDILKDSGKLGCKPSSFPIEHGLKLDKGENEPTVDASQYRRLIGRLLYLQATRPDITYSVNVLSQFVADPRSNHLEAANRILRYLKATPGQGILLSRAGDLVLNAYCDADWLGCSYTRRSRTGYFLLLGGTPISWRTKKQSVVSRSSAEAEYRAMASTVSEVIWVRWLLSELRVDISSPTPLFCDNQAARHIANNPVFHERTKHVEMDCYFVRERVASKEIIPMQISSKMQIADLLTKGLTAQQLQFLLGKISISNLHATS
ncbi:hypothetical protein OSB04_029131 [Centaurea solstitialis]|uniref:Integrase catalytic domain-containing protein n=1 Tax=Centaurea solstitialis TaxID=347529 RepID=A0AA38SH44_9ASTR|nr:hypothetical protein OSB04_029131 [Centaurea solstitialis]